ncbi:MAG TPA: hypothetical protein VF265_09100 [Nevskiaceae bacterium]
MKFTNIIALAIAATLGLGISSEALAVQSSQSLGNAESTTSRLPTAAEGKVFMDNGAGAVVQCDYAPENYLQTFTNCRVRDGDPATPNGSSQSLRRSDGASATAASGEDRAATVDVKSVR